MQFDNSPSMGSALSRGVAVPMERPTRRGKNATEDLGQVMLLLALRLFQGHPVTSKYIRERFGVSVATAKRYMVRLEQGLPVRVVHSREGNTATLPKRNLADAVPQGVHHEEGEAGGSTPERSTASRPQARQAKTRESAHAA